MKLPSVVVVWKSHHVVGYKIYPVSSYWRDYFYNNILCDVRCEFYDNELGHPLNHNYLLEENRNFINRTCLMGDIPIQIAKMKRYSDDRKNNSHLNIVKEFHKEKSPLSVYIKQWMDICEYDDYESDISKKSVYKYKIYKRRKENMNYLTSAKNVAENMMDRAVDSGVKYAINAVKNHFGKEYIFSFEDEREVIISIINDFLAKIDKNFDLKAQKNKYEKYELRNTEFILPLGKKKKDTFIYVATGNKMGSFEDRFMSSRNISEQDMKIFIFGKRSPKVIDRLESVIAKATMLNDELGIYDISSGVDNDEKGKRTGLHIVYNQLQPRSMDTMYFSSGEKELIINHINNFKNNYDFYHNRQLFYKTGILFYGLPGTGKSSLVKAIATLFNRSILNVSIAEFEHIDINKLTQAINTDTSQQYIVLLEDIDTLFLNRENETDKEGRKVINKLLQFLDSNSSPNNVIFIATTNYIDRLDPALLRAGRFDLKVEINLLNYEETVRFGKSFGLSESIINTICSKYCGDENKDITKHMYNQSSLQIDFISNLSHKSVEDVSQIYEDTSVVEKKENMNKEDEV